MKRYEFKVAESSFKRQPSTLDIRIKKNAWTCDCETYEIIAAILDQIEHLNQSRHSDMSQKHVRSCYLNYLIHLNKYMFENFANNIESLADLSCYSEPSNPNNWLLWYTKACVRLAEIPTTATVPADREATTRNLDWLITYGRQNNGSSNNPLLKFVFVVLLDYYLPS